jgi:tetratricopeptide (TPR) repeat protein
MDRHLNFKAWLVIGTIATTTLFQSHTILAYTLDVNNPLTTAEIKPANDIEPYQQGLAALAAGNMNQAMVEFNRAIELNPQAIQAYIERGNIKDALHDLPGALADFSTAIKLDPKAADAYYNRATVLTKHGKNKEAVADFNIAIELDPKSAPAYLNRGNNLDDLGDLAGALADYDRAIKIQPNYALVYLNRGVAQERAGNRAKAIADLDRAAQLFKADGDTDKYNRSMSMLRSIQPVNQK